MKKILLILGALVLFGCAGQEALKHGQEMVEAGNEEQGLAKLEEAMKANPNDAGAARLLRIGRDHPVE